MKIFFFGAGKVGLSLASVLKQSGFDVTGLYSRQPDKVRDIESTGVKGFLGNPKDISQKSDIIFFTLPDRKIQTVVKKYYNWQWINSNQIWVHCSGSLPSSVLKLGAKMPAGVLSLHPAQTFATEIFDKNVIKNITFVLEGDANGLNMGTAMVKSLGADYFQIVEENKPLYHAACIMAANFLIAIEDSSVEILKGIGIKEQDAIKLIFPMVERTLKNFAIHGSFSSISGPTVRRDTEVIKNHIDILSKKHPDLAEIYKILTKRLLKILKRQKFK